MTEEERKTKITTILDGWFGESLENSENESNHRQFLYEPLWKVAENIYKAGINDYIHNCEMKKDL